MLEKLIKQGRYTFHCLLITLLFVGFYSCEYDSDDFNYVHLEKPEDEIQLGIDLAGVNPMELIYVYDKSTFSYSLYTEVEHVFARQFYLDGNPIETDQNTGEGYLNTNITDNEIHELKLVIVLKAGTGSLAELANYEMYTGVFTFKIKVIPFSNKLNIRETTDKNNNLKLEWDKPLDYEIAGYSVYKGENEYGELLASIHNPNDTYFVDTDYAYGYKPYTIVAKIKNSFNLTVKDHISVNYWNMTEKDFETLRISANKSSIKWKNPNPFPCKYVLIHGFNKEKIIVEDGINEVIIPVGDFPTWSDSFSLYILPKSADINRYEYYSHVSGVYKDKGFSAISFHENLSNNMLHGLNFKSLNNYDISTMEETTSSDHLLSLHTGCKVHVSKGGRVAINDTYGFVHIYSNYTLNKEITQINAGSYPFKFISNNKVLVEEKNGFKIYDITTNKVITSKLWQSEIIGGDIFTKTNISSDGKYLYIHGFEHYTDKPKQEWVELYEIVKDNSLQLLETHRDTKIQSIYFHPFKDNVAIIQYSPFNENEFEINNIVTKEKKKIKGEFMNIDPFTGNLLFKGEEYQSGEYNLYVWDKDYSTEKIKIKLANINPFVTSSLFNNNLFFNGYYVDLSNLKEWKQ